MVSQKEIYGYNNVDAIEIHYGYTLNWKTTRIWSLACDWEYHEQSAT